MAICRSILFVPGNRPDLIAKIHRFEADAYLLDLEDGVPESEKESARRIVSDHAPALLKAGHRLHLRVNAVHTPWHREDVAAGLSVGLTTIHVPKVMSADDVRSVDHWTLELSMRWGIKLDTIEIFPTIETSRAVLEADAVAAASARVTALVVGADDLTAEWGAPRTPDGHEIDYVRQLVVVAANAYGAAPIDATYPFLRDLEGCERDARRARAFGFRGKQAIHPAQCPIFNRTFVPAPTEIERARAILAAADGARGQGRGTSAAADTQIDAAVERSARRLLEWAATLALRG